LAASASALPVFHAAAYQPAVVYLRFSEDHGPSQAAQPSAPGDDAFLDFTLIPLEGPVKGFRVPLSKKLFISQLRELYASLARQDRLDPTKPASASRQLYTLLIAPIVPFLESKGVTTLLIAADQGLQAVPFAALHDGQRFFGDRYAFSMTPSLALTNFNSSSSAGQPIFVAGASTFDGLAPLPLVPQELDGIGANAAANIFLNRNFTPELFFEKAGDPHYSRIHVASHAEFLPGGPTSSYLYSGVGPMPMSSFSRLRLLRKGAPLDLITFSACRTALGDPSSELGFAGLAIQAGARSAAGTLWYVDDVASSAFFIQMYRYLNQGVPKAEAVQLTRQLFMRGLLHLEGDRLLSADGSVVLDKLDSVQQRRVRDGLDHPYFWAGIELVGSPW
jgi:CHAT domain-containing protein